MKRTVFLLAFTLLGIITTAYAYYSGRVNYKTAASIKISME